MNFTAVFCCYVLLPYFASFVFPPQEAITCYAAVGTKELKKTENMLKRNVSCFNFQLGLGKASSKYLMTRYFVQNLDHYHYTDLNTWKQKYLIYNRHYDGNGVIFLRIGTDVEITEWNMQNGRWFKYCEEANALCVGIELRGYGVSLPNGNLETKNLKYLTNEQALADVARFIYNFRSQQTDQVLPEKLKWVVHGRGKQGALAAWLRMKFPHLVHAAFSLSASVLAKESYDDYFKLIESEMLDKDVEFKGDIEKAYQEIQKINNQNNNFKELNKFFNFCDVRLLGDELNGNSLTKLFFKENTEFMYFIFAKILGAIMQFGNDDLEFVKRREKNIISGAEKHTSPIERFANIIKKMLRKYKKKCLQISKLVAKNEYSETDSGYTHLDFFFPEIFGNRTTLYQSCFEMGQFETFDDFFGTSIGLIFYTDFCMTVFEKITSKILLEEGVRKTNIFYGGLNIEISHVFFVYGSDDPYRKLGVIDRIPEKSVTRLLEGARHCYELDKVKYYPGLNELKENIFHHLLDWLEINDKNIGGYNIKNSQDTSRSEWKENN